MQILLAGDTHGNLNQFVYLHFVMRTHGITRGIVVGDFGLWPGPKGDHFLHELENMARDDGITWDWLDGNHENHTLIQEWMREEGAYSRPHALSPHVNYLPRGYRFEIDGCRFITLGGAWSIDKDSRVPYVSWWPEEEITEADVRRALSSDEAVDIMLTHDMPADQEAITALGFQMHPGGGNGRLAVSEVMYALKPKLLIHGHMHRRYSTWVDTTQIEGLDCDGTLNDSYVIIDTDHWKNADAS